MKTLALMLIAIAAFGLVLSQTIPEKQEKEPVVKLPISKWVVVLKGVSELPLKESQDIYMTIVAQINQQMQDTLTPKKK